MATVNFKEAAFEQSLAEFKKELWPESQAAFRATTFAQVLCTIEEIERDQASNPQYRLGRLKLTLDALHRFGGAIELYVNSAEYMGFILGALKQLIKTTGAFHTAFEEVLDIYDCLGEALPFVSQDEEKISQNGNRGIVLGYIYKDILEISRRTLRYFQQPMWREMFQTTWNTQKAWLIKLLNFNRVHRDLAAAHSSLDALSIKAYSDDREKMDQELRQLRFERDQIHREVCARLSPIQDSLADLDSFSQLRAPYPGTGQWLLDNPKFKEWFDPLRPSASAPVLWLNGIPGAGKTILASLVIEEAQRRTCSPVVLYYFFRYDGAGRNNFASVVRDFLYRLLHHDRDILLAPYCFDKLSRGGRIEDTTLERLLRVSILNFSNVYIVLDGIDECPRVERRKIASWFRELVENPPTPAKQARCLFVSRDDGAARRDFANVSAIKISSKDNHGDIEQFCSNQAEKIGKMFGLSDTEQQLIARQTVDTANGMFMLARLMIEALFHQPTTEMLKDELRDQYDGRVELPDEIGAVYSCILTEIFKSSPGDKHIYIRRLLTCLVYAQRPMTWQEIQEAQSFDLETWTVDSNSFYIQAHIKDLCGSLVETRSDGTVELVHPTAKEFLIRAKRVDPARGELQLASICLHYLTSNLTGFTDNPQDLDHLISKGYFKFMDYAACYWALHLGNGLSKLEMEDPRIIEISRPLEGFLELHFLQSTPRLDPVSASGASRLRVLKGLGYYNEIAHAVASILKESASFGDVKDANTAINFPQVVRRLRTALERLHRSAKTGGIVSEELGLHYGPSLFKCPILYCRFFSAGFEREQERDQHLKKHAGLNQFQEDQAPLELDLEGGLRELKHEVDRQRQTNLPRGEDEVGNVSNVESNETTSAVPPSDSGYGTASQYTRAKVATTRNASAIDNHVPDITMPEDSAQVEDDTKTLYSDAASLSDPELDRYALAFATDIAQRLDIRTTLNIRAAERVSNVLPGLLQGLAMKLGYEAPDKMHRDTMFFLHKYRGPIAEGIRRHLDRAVPAPEAKQSYPTGMLHEWLGSLAQPTPASNILDNDLRLMGQERDISPTRDIKDEANLQLPGIEYFKKLIAGDSAYQWLLDRLYRELNVLRQDGDVMDEIHHNVLSVLRAHRQVSRQQSSQAVTVFYDVNWDVKAFLAEQDYQQPDASAIMNAVTLTGSDVDVQALSCLDYMKRTWPQIGPFTLGLVRQLLDPGHTGQVTGKPMDGLTLSISLTSNPPRRLVVEAVGIPEFVTEIGEQLAWLGAAMRSSPYGPGQVARCVPVVDIAAVVAGTDTPDAVMMPPPRHTSSNNSITRAQQEMNVFQCTIDYKLALCRLAPEQNGRCWRGMFNNPVIAEGFPITQRTSSNPSHGMEVPLNIMAELAQSQFINKFKSKVFIKGFSTMLVPTAKHNDIVMWHFLYNQNPSNRISYLNCSVEQATLTLAEIEASRHVVGWCPEAVTHVGRSSAASDVKPSGLPEAGSKHGLDKIEISAAGVFGATGVFALGQRDKPAHITRNGYHNRLQWIASKQVIFWDEGDKRGWLVNGAGAVLHLLRESLYHSKRVFGDALLLDPSDLPNPCPTDYLRPDFALPLLMKPEIRAMKMFEDSTDVYTESTVDPGPGKVPISREVRHTKYYCIKDRIEHIHNTLEKLIDYKTDLEKPQGISLLRPRKYIEGWDFSDIVGDGDPFFLRVCTLQAMGKGWVDFARGIHALTLFGRGFGDLIETRQPVIPSSLSPSSPRGCPRWSRLPKGRSYLAIRTLDLQQLIIEDQDTTTPPSNLRNLRGGLIWQMKINAFDTCPCIARAGFSTPSSPRSHRQRDHHDPVQVFFPLNFLAKLSKKTPVCPLGTDGAVIFGHNVSLHWYWPDDEAQGPIKGDPPLPVELDAIDLSQHSILTSGSVSPARSSHLASISSASGTNISVFDAPSASATVSTQATSTSMQSAEATSRSRHTDGPSHQQQGRQDQQEQEPQNQDGKGKKRKSLPEAISSAARRVRR